MPHIIPYFVTVFALLALVFLAGYIIGTNRGYVRLQRYIMRMCAHQYEDVGGVKFCMKCGHIKKE